MPAISPHIGRVDTSSFVLRVADTPALVALARTLVAEYAAMPHVAGRWSNAPADIAALPAPYVLPTGVLLVALEAAHPSPPPDEAALGTGALIAYEPPAIAEIKRVYVRPRARGRGIGEAVTRALLDWAGRLGFTRVRLDTAPELLAARALYERLGFEAIPPYRTYDAPGTLFFERSVGSA